VSATCLVCERMIPILRARGQRSALMIVGSEVGDHVRGDSIVEMGVSVIFCFSLLRRGS
jgi:hypothetical protein